MKKLKVGVVGAGGIANDHINNFQSDPRTEVVAVMDANLETAKTKAKRFNVPVATSKVEDLMSNRDIDIISVATPNCFHAPYSIAALKAGKHVLCDKPFAMNQKEAIQVIAAAKKAKKIFMVGMNQRFTRQSQATLLQLRSGAIGDPYFAKAYWLRRAGIPGFGGWFTTKKMAGGGALLDIGVHLLDLCLHLINNFEPLCVTGASYNKLGCRGIGKGTYGETRGNAKFDVDDFTTSLIKLKGGMTVELKASWAFHQPIREAFDVEINGTEGAIMNYAQKLCRFGKADSYEVIDYGVPSDLPFPAANRYHHFIDVVFGDAKQLCTPEQSLAVQKIIDGIYESSATGKEVRIK